VIDSTTVDFLIIGSGIAGLTCALETSKHGRTLLLTKKNRVDSNTNWAQGGIASVTATDDTSELHVEDTLIAGAGLCHRDAVELLVREGPDRVRDLIDLGAQFTLEEDGSDNPHLALGREGGHSRNRIVFAADHTGWECERTLLAASEKAANLEIREHDFVLDLITSGEGAERRCVGALALSAQSNTRHAIYARATILATGGCGQVYRHTTNPLIATGDGVAIAWRAGATVSNMEFIQFHPTSLYHPEGKSFLISEAVRGEGGILRNKSGEEFMRGYDDRAELAPRDIVARAIHAERLRLGDPCVYLDITHLPGDEVRHRFPTIYNRCFELGIDITKEWIPVVPAAHYQCGGVKTDLEAHTTLPGLLAAGEVTCTGVHGANRLASNSLLEAMVFGRRAALSAIDSTISLSDALHLAEKTPVPSESVDHATLLDQLQGAMDRNVGIVRNDHDLEAAQASINEIVSQLDGKVDGSSNVDLLELRNLACVAGLITRSALLRKESRGLHFTTDYPNQPPRETLHDTELTIERPLNV
jgi:L-aspartate oxidase